VEVILEFDFHQCDRTRLVAKKIDLTVTKLYVTTRIFYGHKTKKL